jgi:hypothetical protein
MVLRWVFQGRAQRFDRDCQYRAPPGASALRASPALQGLPAGLAIDCADGSTRIAFAAQIMMDVACSRN